MNTTVITPVAAAVAAATQSAIARRKLVGKMGDIKELTQSYADALTADFGAEWWLLKGKAKQPLKAERDGFVADMEELGYKTGTIDVMWQRVKEAAGYVTPGNRVKGANDVDTKNLSDLQTMINRIFKAEEAGTDTAWSDEKAVLMDVFGRMGGDVDKLG